MASPRALGGGAPVAARPAATDDGDVKRSIPFRPASSLLLAAVMALVAGLALVACGEDEPAPSEITTATAEGGTPRVESTPSPSSTATALVETPIPEPSETVTSTYFIPTSELPLVRFGTSEGSVELAVELPPRSEYAIGLSGRTSLGERGMLFYRERFGQTGFWMQNTHIDLDIAFVDSEQTIVHITTMLADTADVHRPPEPYVVAIEAPAGWYAEHGIEAGDQVEYLFDLQEEVTD